MVKRYLKINPPWTTFQGSSYVSRTSERAPNVIKNTDEFLKALICVASIKKLEKYQDESAALRSGSFFCFNMR